jgi:hypothetical protein
MAAPLMSDIVGVYGSPPFSLTRMGIVLRPCLRLQDKQVRCNGLLSRSALKQSPAVLVEYLVLCSAQNEGRKCLPRDSGDERPDYQQPTRMGIGDGLGQTDHRKEESQSSSVLVVRNTG